MPSSALLAHRNRSDRRVEIPARSGRGARREGLFSSQVLATDSVANTRTSYVSSISGEAIERDSSSASRSAADTAFDALKTNRRSQLAF